MIDGKTKQKLLDELQKFGNVYWSCLKIGVSRSQYYRWKQKDKRFKEMAEEAESMGRENIVDVAEHGLLKNLNSGNQKAIEYALNRLSKYYKKEAYSSPSQPKTLEDLLDEHTNNENSKNVTMPRKEFERLKDMAALPKVNIEIVRPKSHDDNQSESTE